MATLLQRAVQGAGPGALGGRHLSRGRGAGGSGVGGWRRQHGHSRNLTDRPLEISMADTLTIVDNRTGKKYELPIEDGTIRPWTSGRSGRRTDDFGLMTYDPAFMNTANCRSSITFIDGDKGILRYRGYPIEQLAEDSDYLETAYLILNGELPDCHAAGAVHRADHDAHHASREREEVHGGLQVRRAPDGDLPQHGRRALDLLSRFEAHQRPRIAPPADYRLIAKAPTIAAYAFRHIVGRPYIYPDNDLSYTGNFLNMLFSMPADKYHPNDVLARALDVLFILHADHEQNCSTSAMRNIGSSQADPYSAVAGAAAALYGPLHGGANEAVLRMLDEIGSVEHVAEFIKKVKSGEAGSRLMGFGHRVYKSYDPRAKVIKKIADLVFTVTGKNPKLEIALELERIALQDEYFVKRKLYPNVDFYSGLIYQAMGFPVEMFPVLFAIPRVVGWLAQWQEMLIDPDQKIARPRQIYTGYPARDYVSKEKRQ